MSIYRAVKITCDFVDCTQSVTLPDAIGLTVDNFPAGWVLASVAPADDWQGDPRPHTFCSVRCLTEHRVDLVEAARADGKRSETEEGAL